MNVVTSKLITAITPQLGFEYLEDFGFTTLVSEKTLDDGSVVSDIGQSLALGGITYGVTNLELCAAYAAIANGGVYNEPILYTKVLDHKGRVLLENNSDDHAVIKDSTAWLLTSAMQDVVTEGTSKLCQVPGMTVAGKTGTTSDDNDIWFSGYTPYLTATVWSGFDNNQTLPNTSYHETLWSKIVSRIDETKGYTDDPGFPKPDSVVEAKICSASNKLAIEGVCGSSNIRTEYFSKATVPTDQCDVHSGHSSHSSNSSAGHNTETTAADNSSENNDENNQDNKPDESNDSPGNDNN